MATTFVLLNKDAKGLVPLYIRIQHPEPKTNIRIKTDLQVPAEKWKLNRNGAAWENWKQSESGSFIIAKTDDIRVAIDSRLRQGKPVTVEEVKKICNNIIYREEREERLRQEEAKRLAEAEAKKMTLSKYISTCTSSRSSPERGRLTRERTSLTVLQNP